MRTEGRWPIDMSKVNENKIESGDDKSHSSTSDHKKKKKEVKKEPKEPLAKAPKLKISSSSMMRDDRVNNAFKFDDSELKGSHRDVQQHESHPTHSGKRRKTDEKSKIDYEPERVKLKQKLSLKKSSNHLPPSASLMPSPDIAGEKVFSSSASSDCSPWKYTNKLVDAISGMVEEMYDDAKSKFRYDTERAIELAKMAAELEKEQFKLEYKRSMERETLKEGNSHGDKCRSKNSAEEVVVHEALEEQRIAQEADKEQCLEELRQRVELEKEEAIAETKKHQWCASCSQAAMYHCCWNTSYCGYNCQTSHWPQHMYKCEQQNRAAQQGTSEGMVLARQAPSQSPSQLMPPEMNSRPD